MQISYRIYAEIQTEDHLQSVLEKYRGNLKRTLQIQMGGSRRATSEGGSCAYVGEYTAKDECIMFRGVFKLYLQLSKERLKHHPAITHGLDGQCLGPAIPAPWFVFGPQPGHVADKIECFNLGNISVANVAQSTIERVFVGGDCAVA